MVKATAPKGVILATGDGLKLGAWAGAAIQQHHAPQSVEKVANPSRGHPRTPGSIKKVAVLSMGGRPEMRHQPIMRPAQEA